MARLFITGREIDLISDLTREIIRDCVGQRIFYYSISREKSRVHDVYGEAIEKIFESPIELDALVEWNESEVVAGTFGTEQVKTVTAHVHARDVINRELNIAEGDFFSFGPHFFEIVQATDSKIVYGQIDHPVGIKIIGKQTRASAFATAVLGPTGEQFADDDAVQKAFYQQRGLSDNKAGETADKRDLVDRGVLEPASPKDQREVTETGDSKGTYSFYDE